jgi:hypothetical protein
MNADDPDIDFTTLDFPTDTISIKDMRRRHPDRFDVRRPEHADKTGSLYEKLSDLIFCERAFSANTYDQARGKYRNDGLYGEDLEIVREGLAKDYIGFGLAAGRAQAEEFVRSVERQVLQQAERHRGKGR